jgi:hypothetical protein
MLFALAQGRAQEKTLISHNEADSKMTVGHEIDVETSYEFGAKTKVGRTGVGGVDANRQLISYVATPQIDEDSNLRLGFSLSRIGFGGTQDVIGAPAATVITPIPSSLIDLHLVIGGDVALSDEWLFRAEISPGIYSTRLDAVPFQALNAPLIGGFAYLVNKDLQWFFGFRADARDHKLPIVPAVGVRWHYADQWTLNLMLPKPRLEFEPVKNLKFYVGATIDAGNYYAKANQGSIHGQVVGDESLSYLDATAGGGTEWKFTPNCALEAEAGWLLTRQFDYQDSDKRIHAANAPALKLAVTAKF